MFDLPRKKGEKIIFNVSTVIIIISVEIFFFSCETYEMIVYGQNLSITVTVCMALKYSCRRIARNARCASREDSLVKFAVRGLLA